MRDEAIAERLERLTSAVQLLSEVHGVRLNRAQFAARLGVCRNTLAARLARDPTMPRPGRDGKWRLADIIEWERR